MKKRWIIGIDEVGRGALAGPVVVCAAMIPIGIRFKNKDLGKLKDSKKLTPKKREAWFSYLKDRPAMEFALARVYPRRIEKINISRAANLAAFNAFGRLIRGRRPVIGGYKIFLDGGLSLGNGATNLLAFSARRGRTTVTTVVRGDEKIRAIAVASIVAKVVRDRFMERLTKKYPAYGFEVHKGYGTKAHYEAIRERGLCDAHRKTFCR